MTDQTRTILVEVTVAAPFDVVWRALRDRAEIRRWHGWEYEGLDEEIDAIYGAGAEADEEAGTLDVSPPGTRFWLERGAGKTLVRVTKAAPTGEGFDEIDEGWITFVQQLRFALEHHPGEQRRTLHYKAPGVALSASRLGLDAADSAPVGDRWQGTAAWGELLAGEVLYRSAHQVGLSVEEWNDAMLVLHANADGGRAVVSTYGLDEAGLEAIRQGLGAWFGERESNVEVVRTFQERFNGDDRETAFELLSEDFVAEVPPSLSAEPDVYEGHAGARRYLDAFEGQLEDVRFVPLELHEEGEQVIAELVLAGRGVSSGIDVELRSAVVHWVEDGKVVRMLPCPDMEAARKAARGTE